MSTNWVKNNFNICLNDDQIRVIPHPKFELGVHVAHRFAQAFGILGTFVVGPISAGCHENTRNLAGFKQQMTTMGQGGVILGLVAGPVMTYMLMRNEEGVKVWDRCCRLRYNRCQVRVDQLSILGAACGAGIGLAYNDTAVFGSLLGMTSGILLAAIYNSL